MTLTDKLSVGDFVQLKTDDMTQKSATPMRVVTLLTGDNDKQEAVCSRQGVPIGTYAVADLEKVVEPLDAAKEAAKAKLEEKHAEEKPKEPHEPYPQRETKAPGWGRKK